MQAQDEERRIQWTEWVTANAGANGARIGRAVDAALAVRSAAGSADAAATAARQALLPTKDDRKAEAQIQARLRYGQTSGNSDKVAGLDGETYTVSTIQRMGIWETAVIVGRPGLFSRRNHRSVAHVIPGDPVDAQLMHMHTCAMVQLIPPQKWTMDQENIKLQLESAAKYISNRDPYIRRSQESFQFFLGSLPYFYLVESLGAPGARAANFAKQVGLFGGRQWVELYEAAARGQSRWRDDAKREAVTPSDPAAIAILMTVVARGSASMARARAAGELSDEYVELLQDAVPRAAAGLLAPSSAVDRIREDLMSPFIEANVLDVDALEKPADLFGDTKCYWRSADTIAVNLNSLFV